MTSASDGEIDIPLVVDLDGTLTLTDTLYESFVKFLFRNPAAAVAGVLQLARGPAAVKRYIAERGRPDPATLPYRADLIEMIKAEKVRGRAVHLVTAADQSIADDVARHLGLFETAAGSDGLLNLKGPNKLAYLRKTFPGGFLYAGDGSADLPVFTGARGVVLCDVAASTAGRIAEAGIPVAATLRRPRNSAQAWLRAFRVHQWAKNLLLFVPLFVGHAFGDPKAIASSALGFALLCLLSSATYILNDLADLDADRAHASKRLRPFASWQPEDRPRPDRRAGDDRCGVRRSLGVVAAVRRRACRLFHSHDGLFFRTEAHRAPRRVRDRACCSPCAS